MHRVCELVVGAYDIIEYRQPAEMHDALRNTLHCALYYSYPLSILCKSSTHGHEHILL